MGCGKSTLGKKVAKQLNIPFIDSDSEIEQLHSLSIGEIFMEFGESSFRDMEADFIKSLGNQDDFVLSTGGGMPCFNNNMELLNQLGTTYYLYRSAKELANRLNNTKTKRPLLAGFDIDGLIDFIEVKLKERNKFYRQSQVILNREDQTLEDIILLYRLLQPEQIS
jgi:shikimate kinase